MKEIAVIQLLIAALWLVAPSACAADFHVSPKGDDANSGTTDKPLATLERARDAIRQHRAGKPHAEAAMQSRIILHAGTYRLAKALVLAPEDTNITIEAAPGEQVVLSGARVLNGWQPVRDGIVKADLSKLDLPDLNFRELFCGGHRQHWARVPNFDPKNPRRGGFLANDGMVESETRTKLRYRTTDLDPSKWKHPERAWMVFHDAKNYRPIWSPLKGVDAANRVLEAANKADYTLAGDSPYFLCGLLEELNAPGEWCVDLDTKTLHFLPPNGKAEQHEVTVPALDSIIIFQGNPKAGQLVKNVRIQGVALSGCRKEAILMKGAERCEVVACDIRNVGTGVYLADDTHGCRVAGCDITQTLHDGVTIMGSSLDHNRVSDHVIDNNYIWDFGWGDIHNRCGGVFLRRCARITVTHNRIHDGPRYAIGTDVGNDFEIAWNLCHHVNLTTSDSGIIEGGTAWDWRMPDDEELKRNREHNWGNRIHHNLAYDSGGWSPQSGSWRFPDYTWGIYLDLCNSGWHLHSNIVYDTVLGGFMQNAGMECRLENNIFVGGKRSQWRFNNWPGYVMAGHRAERNIISYPGTSASLLEGTNVPPPQCTYARNLIHCQSGLPRIKGIALTEQTSTWNLWQSLGQDAGSVLADPLFVDAAKHDYRLRPESPALKLGIRPLDLSAAGTYASPERRTWPCPEQPVVRPPADYRESVEIFDQLAFRNYEDYAVGEPERVGWYSKKGPVTNRVTDETAASGRKSLRFEKPADQEGSPKVRPFITYPCEAHRGRMSIAFAIRFEPGTQFSAEWRNAPAKYQVGPKFNIDAAGRLIVPDQPPLQLPPSQWVRIETECVMGGGNNGTYKLTVTLPNAAPQVFPDLPHDGKFKNLEAFVIQLGQSQAGGCWIDDLTFKLNPESR